MSYFQKVIEHFVNQSRHLNNVKLGKKCNLAHHCEIKNSSIGDRTSIGRYSKIENTEIGKYCSISWDVTIGAPAHPMDRITTHAFTYRQLFGLCSKDKQVEQKKTKLGNDVWVGCNTVILSGVSVGDGAIIGAGAVVTQDVDAYTVVAGIPAKKIRNRFQDELNEKVKSIHWWDFSDECLKKHMSLFERTLDQATLIEIKRIGDKHYE